MPHLSGRDNAVLSGLMLGLRRREIIARLPAIREFSELGDFFEQPIATYSAGMIMRLAFSVAIQVEPDVLLIDEVLAVGDAEFQQKSGAAMRARMPRAARSCWSATTRSRSPSSATACCGSSTAAACSKALATTVFAAYHRDQHVGGVAA